MKYTIKQEIFDRVAIHLLIQNKKSQKTFNGAHECFYRGNNGYMCAIGCLISDEHYVPEIENKYADALEVVKLLNLSLNHKLNKTMEMFLCDLQKIHDISVVRYWWDYLLSLAEREKLSTDAIDFAIEFKKGMTW